MPACLPAVCRCVVSCAAQWIEVCATWEQGGDSSSCEPEAPELCEAAGGDQPGWTLTWRTRLTCDKC